jgi:hypothetical protein
VQDETGLYTETNKMRKVAETQRRGAAGMGGRTLETTNCWDPAENSVAQTTFESQRKDIFRFYRQPPAKADGTQLSYLKKRERRQIHEYVYAGSWWVNLDSIEAEAAELLETDPAQAERFFGNRIVQGAGAYYPDGLWERAQIPTGRSRRAPRSAWASTGRTATTGRRCAPRPSTASGSPRPTARTSGRPCGTPPSGTARSRALRSWPPSMRSAMHDALERNLVDLRTGRSTHDDCRLAAMCASNARKLARPSQRYILGKPSQHQKIDVTMADVLAHEAACDAREGGWTAPGKPVVPRRIR